jgi:glycosyltransferase involved in cell wall biosynthesis
MISIVIPAYNSELTLPDLIRRLDTVLSGMNRDFEVIVVNDASPDGTWEALKKLNSEYDFLKIIRLMKNSGQHKAILCGFSQAQGDIVVTMDDDLQNPPEDVPKLIAAVDGGLDLAIGSYESKQHSSSRNFFGSIIDFTQRRIFSLPSNFKLTSFRAVRRSVIDNVLQMSSVYPYVTSMLLANAGRIGNVPVEHHQRNIGKSNYTIKRSVSLALNLWLNYSSYPLYFVATICMASFLFAVIFSSYVIWQAMTSLTTSGWASTIVIVAFFNALVLLCLVIHSIYLSRLVNRNFNFSIGESIEKRKQP